MTKRKMYRYLGRTGILDTYVILDGIDKIPLIKLIADKDKILTDGEVFSYSVTVEENEASNWTEVADKNN